MKPLRPWQIWLAAIVCLLLVVTTWSWLSLRALAADEAEQQAKRQAALEENIRLALWRIDTQMASLIADENARPVENYKAALTMPQPVSANGDKAAASTDLVMISPLVNQGVTEIFAYFQIDANGRVTSPQVPDAKLRDRLVPQYLNPQALETAERRLAKLQPLLANRMVFQSLPAVDLQTNHWQFVQWRERDPNNSVTYLLPNPQAGENVNGELAANPPLPSAANSAGQSQQAVVNGTIPAVPLPLDGAAIAGFGTTFPNYSDVGKNEPPSPGGFGGAISGGYDNTASGNGGGQLGGAPFGAQIGESGQAGGGIGGGGFGGGLQLPQGITTRNGGGGGSLAPNLPPMQPANSSGQQSPNQPTSGKSPSDPTYEKDNLSHASSQLDTKSITAHSKELPNQGPIDLNKKLDAPQQANEPKYPAQPPQGNELAATDALGDGISSQPSPTVPQSIPTPPTAQRPQTDQSQSPNQQTAQTNASNSAYGQQATQGSRYFVSPRDVGRRNSQTGNRGAAVLNANPADEAAVEQQPAAPQQAEPVGKPQQQQLRSFNEYQLRQQFVEQNTFNNYRYVNNEDWNRLALNNFYSQNVSKDAGGIDALISTVRTSRMSPLWLNGELLLARRVSTPAGELIQGCQLDWPALKTKLREVIEDLLPNADLVPANAQAAAEPQHLLAALPVRLVPGQTPQLDPPAALSPLKWSLIFAWGSLAVAVVAVGLVGQGTISLSERRAAFVSAVTHELRTPLTTFRMYAEMLAEDMVADEAARRNYCITLRGEADRLSHLVENVLAYARLERGGMGMRRIEVSVGELLKIATERLAARAEQAEQELLIEVPDDLLERRCLTDPGAVEQILFNLVDNAAKYARQATDRRLHLTISESDKRLRLGLRDHGPGVARHERNMLFEPFRKSASQAAVTAPGVGLGLALSRRLARDMGGELRYLDVPEGGACFALELPL